MSTPPRLGRGLNAILGPRSNTTASVVPPAPSEKVSPDTASDVRNIAVDKIKPNPNQPRREFDETALAELANSIRINGVLQPIMVRPVGDGSFELVAGERRWRASQRAGKASIPATIRNLTDQQSLEIALVENLQRQDLGPLDRAEGYQRYLDLFGGTVEQLAVRLAESRANVVNYLRLLKLPPEIRSMLSRNELSMGHARAIAGVSDPQRQLAIARMTARRNLSVRQVESMCREPSADPRPAATTPKGSVRHMEQVAELLSKAIGLPVQVITGRKKNSGKIVISYASIEEFERVAHVLGADSLIG